MHALPNHRLLFEAFSGREDTRKDNSHHDENREEANQDDDYVYDDEDKDSAAMKLDEDSEALVDSHGAEQAETPELRKEQYHDRFEGFDVVVAAAAMASSTSREIMGSLHHHVLH